MSVHPDAMQELLEAQEEANLLTNKSTALSSKEESRVNVLLSKISAIKAGFVPSIERQKRADALTRELGLPISEEQRKREQEPAEKAFRKYLRDKEKDNPQFRTYVALDSTSGNVFIPPVWSAQYQTRLKSYNGLREAGATIVTDKVGDDRHVPFVDDYANVGERLAEDTQSTLTNAAISGTTISVFRYGSKGVLISNQLVADMAYDVDGFLQDIFAKRIGKITQTEFTLGAGGGPAGVIPSLNIGVTAASATAVTLTELNALVKSIDYAYRNEDACWMFSDGVEAQLKSMQTTTGERLFPEMQEGKLLGYRYCINVAMASSLSTGAKTIGFGSWKRAVTIREITPLVVASKERFAEYAQSYYSMIHRQNALVTDVNAAALLQMA